MAGMSAKTPCNNGNIAPPTGAITRMPAALFVYSPRPSIDIAKMFDHIIELNRPTPSIAHIEMNPVDRIVTPTNMNDAKAAINKTF